MLIHDASGAVAVVSAESVRIVGEGCIVLNARAVVLNTGKIPEYDGYALVCCIKSIPDEVQMTITDEGEVRDGYGY